MVTNVREAKARFSKLLEQAHAGQEIILDKAGKPYARRMPLATPELPIRHPGRIPEIDDRGCFDPPPDTELSAWNGEE